MQKKRFPELDALRGFAALYVVFFHYTLGQKSALFFRLGVTAVDLFFLISGFVIFLSLNAVRGGKEFVVNRISRLYPTYWTCVTISFGSMLILKMVHFKMNHVSKAGFIDYLGNMTMFQYYLNIPDLELPYWTMIIEMLFYLLMLLIFQLRLTKQIRIIGCLINVAIIFNYFAVVKHLIPDYTIYFPLMNHFALFFGGIMFYQLINNSGNKIIDYSIVVFCLITQITIYKLAGSAPDHVTFYQYAAMQIIYFIVFTLFVNNRLTSLISKPAVFLGKISFAVYLIHAFLFIGLIGYMQRHFHCSFWIATLCFALPLVIGLATLITVYIEKPYHQKFKRFLSKN